MGERMAPDRLSGKKMKKEENEAETTHTVLCTLERGPEECGGFLSTPCTSTDRRAPSSRSRREALSSGARETGDKRFGWTVIAQRLGTGAGPFFSRTFRTSARDWNC
ncbi:hypothetical protein RRG08_042569 [Elysia crispata]|uniref:Uncharacterized protein n=1 Tax=Elysia crispata TaxID=231223 RepID=A0AAE1CK16_9GAST|nr:hypothetical protein RRG08_042569 [Elysia crispata]